MSAGLVFFTLISLTVRSASGDMYDFTLVASGSTSNFGNLGIYPGLNNNDQVSYVTRSSSTNGNIHRWDAAAPATPITLGSGSFISHVPINDSGAIAYNSAGSRGYIADDSGVTELFNNSFGTNVYGVNNSGDVVAALKASNGDYEVRVRRDGGSSRRVFSDASSGEYSDYGSGGAPSPEINGSGDVAVRGRLRSTSLDGIYVHTSTGIVTIDDASGPLRQFGNIVDINDAGDVAYYGTPDSAVSSAVRDFYIYESGVGSSAVVSNADFDYLSEAGLVINNNRDFVFGGSAGGVAGLFDGSNPLTDRVISIGDTLDGSSITSLLIRRGMLNDSGNFVFSAWLDDDNNGTADRNAIFFATAAAVPEPSSLALSAMGVLAVLAQRRRRKKA
ncbi:PEP-CTERM sorting domain-containing protein [Rubripirellula tenax]|nr:PEP-CTERM sorting domain-containing protein [Rubripirellula tenax]